LLLHALTAGGPSIHLRNRHNCTWGLVVPAAQMEYVLYAQTVIQMGSIQLPDES